MKTIDNVQKAILRSGAVIISFVLISFTVSAQEFWKRLLTNSSFNEIAIAMIETDNDKADVPDKTKTESTFQFYTVQKFADELNPEDWMLTEFYLEMPQIKAFNRAENVLEHKNLMLNKNLVTPENEVDEPLNLDDFS